MDIELIKKNAAALQRYFEAFSSPALLSGKKFGGALHFLDVNSSLKHLEFCAIRGSADTVRGIYNVTYKNHKPVLLLPDAAASKQALDTLFADLSVIARELSDHTLASKLVFKNGVVNYCVNAAEPADAVCCKFFIDLQKPGLAEALDGLTAARMAVPEAQGKNTHLSDGRFDIAAEVGKLLKNIEEKNRVVEQKAAAATEKAKQAELKQVEAAMQVLQTYAERLTLPDRTAFADNVRTALGAIKDETRTPAGIKPGAPKAV